MYKMATIVVGGGLAGLVASLEASNYGNVILIDKHKIGGNSMKATSGINGCMTRWQTNLDFPDSHERFMQDVIASGGGKSNVNLVKMLVENSGDAINWLYDQGVNFASTIKLGGHSCARTHRVADPKTQKNIPIGFHMVSILSKKCKESPNIQILENSKVESLIIENKKVNGVLVTLANRQMKIYASRVILTTGGFSYHPGTDSFLQKYAPNLIHMSTTNGNHAVGDGIRLGLSAGADLVDMSEIQLHPTGFVDISNPNEKVKFLCRS